MQDKIEKNFSKVQDNLEKGKEKVEHLKSKLDTKKVINEAELKKTNLLLEMGILTLKKIRLNEINDYSFNELCNEILELDKIIYENNLNINQLEKDKRGIFCECGYVANVNDKFCVECGRKIQSEDSQVDFKICTHCNNKMDADSNYCICCGNKLGL
ncbi:zinc ribbon domain-containing protein [Clostridium sp. CCUG 7971]|uniref:zinc ribbon domain-containing protein n=1 Tax=Clostridium sp. CCUG 7971 TaxID=2811414 RepID=UPI001ABACF32|nr:zinc ribbon domain-containing protein [Clostridium sp. CCUG 7971]MBO3446019.1 zinc ribbon domain-containing protein [Clostridium sp. CCUG 7971]